MGIPGAAKMGRVTVDVEVANNEDIVLAKNGMLDEAKVRRATVSGIIDSGATRLVLPRNIADKLGLPIDSSVGVRYADQRTATRNVVANVWLKLCGRDSVFKAVVEPDRTDALIGAIVLEDLDLIVDCTHQNVHPRDPKMIISEIE